MQTNWTSNALLIYLLLDDLSPSHGQNICHRQSRTYYCHLQSSLASLNSHPHLHIHTSHIKQLNCSSDLPFYQLCTRSIATLPHLANTSTSSCGLLEFFQKADVSCRMFRLLYLYFSFHSWPLRFCSIHLFPHAIVVSSSIRFQHSLRQTSSQL